MALYLPVPPTSRISRVWASFWNLLWSFWYFSFHDWNVLWSPSKPPKKILACSKFSLILRFKLLNSLSHTFVSLLVLRMPGPGFDSTSPQESSLISSDNLRCEFLQGEKCKPNPIDMNGTYHAFQSEFLLIINPRRGTRTTTIPAWNIRFAFFLEIQCTFWPLLVNLPYNVKSCTTKKTTRCLPRSAACNHNLKLTQKKSQQWNQSMVELGGNKSEKQQCVIKPMGDFTSTPAHSQAMESLWAAAK